MLQNTILTRNKAVLVAFDAGGATDSHERALQQVVEMADGLGGSNAFPGIKQSRVHHTRIISEQTIDNQVKML